MMEVTKRGKYRAGEISVPLLLLYGLADKISLPEKLIIFFEEAGSQDKEKRTYEAIKPFDDVGRDEFSDMIKWLDKYIEKKSCEQ